MDRENACLIFFVNLQLLESHSLKSLDDLDSQDLKFSKHLYKASFPCFFSSVHFGGDIKIIDPHSEALRQYVIVTARYRTYVILVFYVFPWTFACFFF
jgi:hypothetical protein